MHLNAVFQISLFFGECTKYVRAENPRGVLKFFRGKIEEKVEVGVFFRDFLQFLQIFCKFLPCKIQNKAYLYE